MQLPTWGVEFNTVRERAYHEPSDSSLRSYIHSRSMDFCECCGSPGVATLATIADGNGPRSNIALCSKCLSLDAHVQKKIAWLEDNLNGQRLLYVTAAVIFNSNGGVMVCQKPSYLWEFPGGKMDEGEDLVSCLQREIREELAITIQHLRPFLLVDHDYGRVKLRLFSFTAELNTQAEQIQLRDHISYGFVAIEELPQVHFSQADVAIADRLAKSEQRKTFLVP